MVISKPETIAAVPAATNSNNAAAVAAAAAGAAAAAAAAAGGANSLAQPPGGIPQDQIDYILSGISNTGDVKMNNHRKKVRQRFDIIKKLGQGTYGKVQLGINKETGQEVAIKTIKKCKIEAEADLVRIRREVQIMSSVKHPNIIHIYEVFENREKMVLVMEFAAGGELYDYLSERKVLSEEEARRIFRQVATAVYYCHKHKICHRDLKLENILLDEQGNAKIADFGLSNVFDDQRLLGTFCGSPLYASPEIVEGTPYQGPEVDCWSLGVLLYTLVYGSMPFDGSNFKRLVKQISQGDYYEPRKPSRASTLIRDMLTVCPRKRATIEQICSHWWVNENDNVSCLDLAEDLANQTPVRLDVLLSLTPTTITAEQLVVPSADGSSGAAGKAGNERVPRSHSVGSIRDIGAPSTEAERRILDMVAAGGEAALMPSPTRTITPAQSPVQSKRKLQPTVSTENAVGTTAKKKEKPANNSFVISQTTGPLTEETPMETEGVIIEEPPPTPANKLAPNYSQQDMQLVGDLCEQLIQNNGDASASPAAAATAAAPAVSPASGATPVAVSRQLTRGKLDAVVETPEEKDATKVIKKFVNKHKTADLVNAIAASADSSAPSAQPAAQPTAGSTATPAAPTSAPASAPPFVRKCSLQDESTLNKFNTDRRKSRILETAEKFQQMAPAADKPKKLSIPGVSVGSFKKEFERKASNTTPVAGPTPGELRAMEQVAAAIAAAQEAEAEAEADAEAEALATPPPSPGTAAVATAGAPAALEGSDSKNSVASISLDEARRSMENSIALLLQAQNESSKELDQLCAQTETIGVSEPSAASEMERERKLKNARAIIGNAIQPVIRSRPTPLFGIGHSNGVDSGIASASASGSGSGSGIAMGGGSAQMRARSGSNFVGYLATQAATAAPTPVPSAGAVGPPLLLTPSALAAAKQTIQQRLFGGGAGMAKPSEKQPQHLPATWQPMTPQAAYSTASIFQPPSFFKQMQMQYQQKCLKEPPVPMPRPNNQTQQQPQQPISSALFTPPPSPLHGQKHANANSSSWTNSLGYNNRISSNAGAGNQQQTMPNVVGNARTTRPFHNNYNSFNCNNQAQDITFNKNKSTTSTTTNNNNNNNNHNHISTANNNNTATTFMNNASLPVAMWLKSSPGGDAANAAAGGVKTSTASITLKSATLPRRKINAKSEVQLDIKPQPRIMEQPAMRFTTEMQHPVPDLRSAPPREGPIPYSPIRTTLQARATSLEPKEHIITIQRPPQHTYARTGSNTTTRSGSLSRQSTVESESDTTTTTATGATNMSQTTVGNSQPIKKSPREFIIPIAVEGGGFITPRERSIEPSESSHTTASSRSTFTRLRPSRRIGSLLSEAGFDESSPFQKMRTASITREGGASSVPDEDARFTPHRLRSSRPVKKISQDNDSQSSGEEDDDDDGFEILTAENLFSTLLQRVRALTSRLNVNNDLTAGFPSHSSRLLTASPFWTQSGSPFGSRLNSGSNSSGLGAPWRHSMSRDLGSDMESMFSRTGATLPRGHSKSNSKSNQSASTEASETNKAAAPATAPAAAPTTATEEPLDLADLDLSRLRLSKKDLETLSSITPGLPKCFQEQLLAKLPPTQARKLSRTLSVQNGTPSVPAPKVYKRSQSGGRGYQLPESNFEEECTKPTKPLTDAPKTTAASTAIYRRSLSRSRYDYESSIPTPTALDAVKSRSSSVCRDDYGKSSLCNSSYTSDINDKYKYYSPYLSKSTTPTAKDSAETVAGAQKRYSAALGRPPSGCLSPTSTPLAAPVSITASAAQGLTGDGSSSLRRRSSQRRISRFLRPDFFDEPPAAADENSYQRERRQRERETQSVLREIREKSSERAREQTEARRKHSLPNVEAELGKHSRHARNKSMEMYTSEMAEPCPAANREPHKRRSLSRPREIVTEVDKHELADKILEELQLLSAVRTQHERRLSNDLTPQPSGETTSADKKTETEEHYNEQTSTIKKVKKLKPKEKSAETCADNTTAMTTTTTTVVRKVKKVVKKTPETAKTPTANEPAPLANEVVATTPKETKLKRPKSYPMKDLGLSLKSSELPAECTAAVLASTKLPSKVPTAGNEASVEAIGGAGGVRESRLVRPKSYPATKLATPKELKKVTRSGVAMPSSIQEVTDNQQAAVTTPSSKSGNTSRQSTSEEKSLSATPTEKANDNSSSSDSRPTTIKKIIKVSKKSKLVPPTPVSPTSPITSSTTTSNTPIESKESSPVIKAKEKSPEKKPSKGLLYAIGQKFEKLRDSALSKEKKAAALATPTTPTALVCGLRQSSPEPSSPPEQTSKERTSLLRKKKSLEKLQENANSTAQPSEAGDKRSDKRSRFDSMLRSLRERSVPRQSSAKQDSRAAGPKRAASVENLPASNTGSGKPSGAVNKMFGGLFRRFDRESSEQRRVRSTRSTSNIERQLREETPTSSLSPASPIYQNAATIASVKAAQATEENCNCETACPDCIQNQGMPAAAAKPTSNKEVSSMQSNKEKRKGLMLDLAKLERLDTVATTAAAASSTANTAAVSSAGSSYRAGKSSNAALINGNGLYSNLPPYPGAVKSASNNSSSQQSMDNVTNNNSINTNNNSSSLHTSQTSGYRTSSAHEINRNNLLTPSFENIANYSSDSRSYQDDCASTSTFMSPTEEPELYFDNWSVCSEDNYMLHATPSPTVSRLSRASQLSSPTRCSESSDPNESVIDRIKRRSFYSRFNEKKPRRTSSIVGPSATRDFYREQQAAVKARSSHKLHVDAETAPRGPSPDITQQFFRPLKLSPIGTELKPPVYRSPLDYAGSSGAASKPRKSLNDIRTNTSPSFLSKRYGSSSMDAHDYTTVPMRYKSSSSSSPSNGGIGAAGLSANSYYSTYNPKRRSSYTLNGTLPHGTGSGSGTGSNSSAAATSSRIDGYATLGRRSIRPYDHRTMSLLEPHTSSGSATSSSYHRREARTPVRDYTASISRSGSRYRTSSATRSPTNI